MIRFCTFVMNEHTFYNCFVDKKISNVLIFNLGKSQTKQMPRGIHQINMCLLPKYFRDIFYNHAIIGFCVLFITNISFVELMHRFSSHELEIICKIKRLRSNAHSVDIIIKDYILAASVLFFNYDTEKSNRQIFDVLNFAFNFLKLPIRRLMFRLKFTAGI